MNKDYNWTDDTVDRTNRIKRVTTLQELRLSMQL